MIRARKYYPEPKRNNYPFPDRQPVEETLPRTSIKTRAMALGVILACVLLSLVVLAQYAYTVEVSREIHRMERSLNESKENISELKLEEARLGSLERIEEVAREELGMQKPENDQVIYVPRKRAEETISSRED